MPIERRQKGPLRASRRPRLRHFFCWPCDRWTWRAHRHADATFSALVAREVRP